MTEPLTQAAEIFEAVSRIKAVATGFSTSFFAGPQQTQVWLNNQTLSCQEGRSDLLIFRRDQDFHHIYHVAASTGHLQTALQSITGAEGNPWPVLTADLVGPASETETVAGVYRECGFTDYASLVRMIRVADGTPDTAAAPTGVEIAGSADLGVVSTFLTQSLDRFRDQIPDVEALEAALALGNILIERRTHGLGGLLFFETTGLTSHLRYWYVDPRFQNQGIGGRLLKTWFRVCCGCKRFILWVVSDNEDAIARYRHYGFRDDRLVDRIMIYRKEQP